MMASGSALLSVSNAVDETERRLVYCAADEREIWKAGAMVGR